MVIVAHPTAISNDVIDYSLSGQSLLGSGVRTARRVLPETVSAGLQHKLPQEQSRQCPQHCFLLADADGDDCLVWRHQRYEI